MMVVHAMFVGSWIPQSQEKLVDTTGLFLVLRAQADQTGILRGCHPALNTLASTVQCIVYSHVSRTAAPRLVANGRQVRVLAPVYPAISTCAHYNR